MAIIKCKMCGGDLNIEEGASVAECEYCGSRQTVPTQDSEKKLTLFGRANRLRLACEFDKAAGVYESIVAEFPEEAEAYWGLVLCRYGIEYVDDPRTGKKIPTCHRSSFDSVMEDQDFEQACENADAVARKVYREEAKAIEELRRGILEVSGKEAPYDIFICYKETDDKGDRTIDSVIAQDVYDALTEKGYRVFFSRISLEDKLGTEYEPYIFAALNSAKIMLAFGTDYEYFNAVWVKNEWSRFLALVASGQKKMLIPCYKNIDAYDMPKEFARLQAQDMGKVGAIQDLLRGIEKILPSKKAAPAPTSQPVPAANSGANPTALSLLKRGNIFLADGDWDKANEYFDKTLDIDPENGDAYAGKLCAEMHYRELEDMAKELIVWNIPNIMPEGMTESEAEMFVPSDSAQANMKKALRYGSAELKTKLNGFASEAATAAKKKIVFIKPLIEKCAKWKMLACGDNHCVGVCANGTVLAYGDNDFGECDVQDWSDIIAVASTNTHTVGLKSDGTVVATGSNNDGQCDVNNWRGVVFITCSRDQTVGLRSDGTVVATGDNCCGQCDVTSWRDIIAITCSNDHTVGLRSDGTVLATGLKDENRCNVDAWRDIVAISCTGNHTVGLRSDGTVLATSETGEIKIEGWKDIVAISCSYTEIVGLRSDGTVLIANYDGSGLLRVDNLKNVAEIYCGNKSIMGLRTDGSVVAIGIDDDGKARYWLWKEIKDIVAISDYSVIITYNSPYIFVRSDGQVVKVDYRDENEILEGMKLFDSVDQFDREMTQRIEKGARLREELAKTDREFRRQQEEAETAERQRVAAEIATLEEKRAALQEELSKVKGLFSGRRRWELESQILEITNQIGDLSARAGIDAEDGQP